MGTPDAGSGVEPLGPVVIGDRRFVPMIDETRLREGIARVAAEISARYADRVPLVVGVLNGGAIFHAELIRRMSIPLRVDYLRASSYHGGTESSGHVRFTAEPGTLTAGENVILVEDIVDTGRTAARLRRFFMERGAASVELATLLYKKEADVLGGAPEYVAFEIPDRFVVGFGLDYMELGRNIPAIYVLDEEG